jgi:hypothetical protein
VYISNKEKNSEQQPKLQADIESILKSYIYTVQQMLQYSINKLRVALQSRSLDVERERESCLQACVHAPYITHGVSLYKIWNFILNYVLT